jgi:hypothetical protein
MSTEKRRFTRVPFKVKATLTVDAQHYTTDHLDNLSVGGCLLPLAHAFRSGVACQLQIRMGGASSDLTIKVEGEVVRTTDSQIAVKFVRIEPDSLFHLQNIILYNAADPAVVEQEIDARPGIR